MDGIALRTDEQVDATAAQRDLYLTLDGVHLNSVGAKLAAAELAATIEGEASPL